MGQRLKKKYKYKRVGITTIDHYRRGRRTVRKVLRMLGLRK